MTKVKVHKAGLAVGGFLAIVHAAWALMVLSNTAKPSLDFIFGLHFLNFQYSINAFSFPTAAGLVIVTGIIGYVFGAVLGWVWNMVHGSSHNQ
ncbi:MAG: hypothetical protein A3J09_01565 [Candidatus Zambryskibacteria bacterium RIFCSPLOWO2_02_FULL_51_21]|uniref:Uncharacterized protein n=1 Tax=Candidatus Zambryskibacteria bacterium RIFCSPHIGHO2_02_FULL_43_37 TaxID=1802749 RepID=A0A1G2TH16_9BACT|nr:MAG: hypothetical protein A2723_01565 [Candidatus Zambryskibacteria bacterium RIFCSPHIGHO2_01_FULL_52_18]OHA96503.1 MAG: hypothetical protein A3D49_01335 [Candidatus Zambryskibacteria bacterium RIFCSPHIGHO2_02_FULL_43_37]OHB07173.1 MAG: hypothetical protein A2944_01100 [Candidatus Zambryskibacteria bacterium RIFCSPLOWO2_01_FULL_52_12]OHB11233.1 MAG: hypothetical protein A3J09_01565 [Candidatus Zambryskibacteria bacterium RIFCSPLOWO2_02_FULL_51_21]